MQLQLQLNWIKCQNDVWCKLNSVNLDHEHFNNREGVYIIWHGGPTPAVVYVGQGNIKARLDEHRSDQRIQRYASWNLYVTWATVGEQQHRDGVEAYLASIWRPIVGEKYPLASHIVVNFPWQ